MPTLLLTPEEAAAELRIGRSRMYDLIKRGEVESVLLGGRRRIIPESLRSYVDRLLAEQSGAASESNPAA